MDLVTPDFGLALWTTVAFLILLGVLKKFAWSPILKAIDEREHTITDALTAAEQAREEMNKLHAQNEDLLREARIERDKILKEARDAKDSIISESKVKAQQEADKIMASARQNIHHEKMAAISDLKNQVAQLSIEIAEKIIHEQLKGDEQHKRLVNNLMENINLN